MRRTVLPALIALVAATSLHAQEQRRNSPPPPAPAPKPRIGYAAPPAPPPQQQPVQVVQPVYYYTPDGYYMSGAPYVGLSDGSVLVNFGAGYERVLRACAQRHNATPSDPWAKDVLGRIPEPPGIAAIKNGARGQVMGAAPARNSEACYRSDASGQVNVVTY